MLTGGTGEEEKVKKKKEWLFVAGIFLLASYPAFSKGWQGGLDSGYFLHVLNQTGERGVFLYRLLVVLIHLATAAASYWSFSKIFADKRVGIVGCLFYTLLPYRLGLLYCSGDLGSGAALAVLPLVFAVLFELYGREEGADKRLWIPLSVLYTLLFQLQILDFLVAAVFSILLMLCFWKKTFRKDMLLTLGKTVVGFCILNGWLFVKLFYFFRQGQLPLYFAGNGKIQSRGVYFSNFLQLYFVNGGNGTVEKTGMQQFRPFGIGFGVTFCILVFLWLCFVGRNREKRQERKVLWSFLEVSGILGFLFAWGTTNSFPWDFIQGLNKLFLRAIGCLYAPTRLMPVAALCLICVACGVVWQFLHWEKKELGNAFMTVTAVMAVVSALYLESSLVNTGVAGAFEKEADVQAEYALETLDISPLDYARYEISGAVRRNGVNHVEED